MVAAAQRRATVPATRALASTRRSVQPAMLRPEGDRGGLARAGSSKASQVRAPKHSGSLLHKRAAYRPIARVWVYVRGCVGVLFCPEAACAEATALGGFRPFS